MKLKSIIYNTIVGKSKSPPPPPPPPPRKKKNFGQIDVTETVLVDII